MKALTNHQTWQLFWALIVIGIVFETIDLALPGKLPIPSLVDMAKQVWRAL